MHDVAIRRYVILCDAMLCYTVARLCHAVLCQKCAKLYHAVLCYAVLCHAIFCTILDTILGPCSIRYKLHTARRAMLYTLCFTLCYTPYTVYSILYLYARLQFILCSKSSILHSIRYSMPDSMRFYYTPSTVYYILYILCERGRHVRRLFYLA